jgi:Lhr-like helicase
MAAVNPVTCCRQIFKELRILTISSLYILEVISYLRRHQQFLELNSNIHTYNTRRKMDIHIQSYKTDLYKRSVLNMGSKLYNKLPDYIKKNTEL